MNVLSPSINATFELKRSSLIVPDVIFNPSRSVIAEPSPVNVAAVIAPTFKIFPDDKSRFPDTTSIPLFAIICPVTSSPPDVISIPFSAVSNSATSNFSLNVASPALVISNAGWLLVMT